MATATIEIPWTVDYSIDGICVAEIDVVASVSLSGSYPEIDGWRIDGIAREIMRPVPARHGPRFRPTRHWLPVEDRLVALIIDTVSDDRKFAAAVAERALQAAQAA